MPVGLGGKVEGGRPATPEGIEQGSVAESVFTLAPNVAPPGSVLH